MRLTGQVSSMAVAMLVLGVRLGHVAAAAAPPDALIGALRLLFALFAGVCVLGVFPSLARGKVRATAP
jgi:hypothetical protein